MVWTLSGFMGSGKSTVGRLLAGRLKRCRHIDLDEQIVATAGRTIPEIFRLGGESLFREMETEALMDAVSSYEGDETLVISLGGGTLKTPLNREIVRAATRCIYLRASAATLAKRLEPEQAIRPLLQGEGPLEATVARLLAQRESLYAQCADLTVDTDGKDAGQVADEIGKIVA